MARILPEKKESLKFDLSYALKKNVEWGANAVNKNMIIKLRSLGLSTE